MRRLLLKSLREKALTLQASLPLLLQQNNLRSPRKLQGQKALASLTQAKQKTLTIFFSQDLRIVLWLSRSGSPKEKNTWIWGTNVPSFWNRKGFTENNKPQTFWDCGLEK